MTDTDTPRTDAALCAATVSDRAAAIEISRTLERDLTALAQLVERYDRTNDVRLGDVVTLAHKTLAATQAAIDGPNAPAEARASRRLQPVVRQDGVNA